MNENQNLSPRDFVIWQKAIMDMIGDRAPTEAEWKMLRDKHDEVFGAVISYDFFKKMEEDKLRNMEKELKKAQADQFSRMLSGPLGSGSAKTAIAQHFGPVTNTAGVTISNTDYA